MRISGLRAWTRRRHVEHAVTLAASPSGVRTASNRRSAGTGGRRHAESLGRTAGTPADERRREEAARQHAELPQQVPSAQHARGHGHRRTLGGARADTVYCVRPPVAGMLDWHASSAPGDRGRFGRAETRLHRLVAGVSADARSRRPEPSRWSIAECVTHLKSLQRLRLSHHPAAAPHRHLWQAEQVKAASPRADLLFFECAPRHQHRPTCCSARPRVDDPRQRPRRAAWRPAG